MILDTTKSNFYDISRVSNFSTCPQSYISMFFFFFNFKIQKKNNKIFTWTVKRNGCKRFGWKPIKCRRNSALKLYFRKSPPNGPKMTLNATRQRYPIYVSLLPISRKFPSVSLYDRGCYRYLRTLLSPYGKWCIFEKKSFEYQKRNIP